MQKVYLDNAAATPLDTDAFKAMLPYYKEKFYNPSALYGSAHDVHKDLEAFRSKLALLLGARPQEIIFTASGTESTNLAIQGVMSQYPSGNIVVSAIEHEAVLAPAGRYDHRIAPVRQDGVIDIEALEKLIDNNTVMVSVMYANNEIGTIQPLKQLAALIDKIRRARQGPDSVPLYFHTDAAQAGNYLDLHVHALGVDLLSLNSSKIYGPKGVGALYVSREIVLSPIVGGGGQELGRRSGTENTAGIAGFVTALEKAVLMKDQEVKRLQAMQAFAYQDLSKIQGLTINGSKDHRIANNIHFSIKGADNERLVYMLDERGYEVATGSACSASDDKPSHVLKAIGLDNHDARSSIRLSMGRSTTSENIRDFVYTLATMTITSYTSG